MKISGTEIDLEETQQVTPGTTALAGGIGHDVCIFFFMLSLGWLVGWF